MREHEDLSNAIIVAPDVGRAKLAEKYTDILGLPLVLIHKRRRGAEVEVAEVVGEVAGKTPIIIDDIIASGSIYQQADALVNSGANPAVISITHPVLIGDALDRLDRPSIRKVVATNTVPVAAEKRLGGKVQVLSIAPLVADAILRIHQHRSVSEVFTQQKLVFPV